MLSQVCSDDGSRMSFPFKVADINKIKLIQASPDLPIPMEPQLPQWTRSMTTLQKLASIQAYIEEFQYNYTSRPYVELKKSRGRNL